MKKSLLALAALSTLAGAAHAEVNLYGILDVGVAQLTHAGDFSPNFVTSAVPTGSPVNHGTATGMMNGGESATRWGIKGSEDLGGGNKAFFQLESGFNLGSGTLATSGLAGAGSSPAMIADTSLNGQLFGRAAFVGLSNGDLGALSFGRQNNLELDVIASIGGGYDPVNAQMFSPINFSGSYGGGGATDDARVDNAIKYAKSFGNFNVNALYGLGGNATSSSARSVASLNLGYEANSFGVQLAATNAKDSTGISANAAPNTVNVKFEDLTSYMAAVRYQVIDPLTLKAGYERMEISAPSNYSADAAMTNIYSYTIGTNAAFSGPQKNINVYWVGGNYQFTPATKLSLGYYDAETQAFGSTASGSDKYYSGMIEYNLSKRTNLYAAVMHDNKSGSAIGKSDTYDTYGIGIRHKF